MKKLLLILLTGLFLVSCTGESLTGKVIADENTLCAILPMSGIWAIFGEQAIIGLQAAADEFGYDLVVEDDKYDPKESVTAARTLLARGCKELIVPFIETAKPILPLTHPENIPIMLIFDSTIEVDRDPTLFCSGFSTEGAGIMMAEYAEGDTAVLVRDQNDYAITISDAFGVGFDGTVLETITTQPGDDFRTLVTKLNHLDPDVVYFLFSNSDAASFLKIAEEQNLRSSLYSGAAFSPNVIEAAGSAAEGVCKTDLPPTNKFPEAIVPAWAALGYDAARGMILADEVGSLKGLKYTSITGEEIDLAGSGRDEVIYCVEDGVAKRVD